MNGDRIQYFTGTRARELSGLWENTGKLFGNGPSFRIYIHLQPALSHAILVLAELYIEHISTSTLARAQLCMAFP